jgi:FemAB-related protein (PEP-CTERM system-associated)
MRIEVAEAAPADWDSFVASARDATAWHLASAVEIGRQAFGLRTWFVTARTPEGLLAGALPLVEQSSRLFGRFLTSLPFVNYGGILAAEPETVAALAEAAAALGRERGAKHVELRHSGEHPQLSWPSRLDKVSMVLPLPSSEEALSRQLGAKLRSQIKRADREKPQAQWGGAELLPEFHRVFALTMRDLGTPVYPLSFFEAVLRAVQERASVLIVRAPSGGRTIPQAAAILVRHDSRCEVPWAAAGQEAKRRSLNMILYWEQLRHAIGQGAPAFDFGRSTMDSGTYRFKAQWGAQPLQLRWHYSLPAGSELPMLNAHNPKFALATAAWRRLPLPLANLLGPHLIRHLP